MHTTNPQRLMFSMAASRNRHPHGETIASCTSTARLADRFGIPPIHDLRILMVKRRPESHPPEEPIPSIVVSPLRDSMYPEKAGGQTADLVLPVSRSCRCPSPHVVAVERLPGTYVVPRVRSTGTCPLIVPVHPGADVMTPETESVPVRMRPTHVELDVVERVVSTSFGVEGEVHRIHTTGTCAVVVEIAPRGPVCVGW
jgi:hypothetical protein